MSNNFIVYVCACVLDGGAACVRACLCVCVCVCVCVWILHCTALYVHLVHSRTLGIKVNSVNRIFRFDAHAVMISQEEAEVLTS